MLSRFANIRSQGATKCVMPMLQRITAVHTSAPLKEEEISRKEFPPATSKRDFVNYPSLIMRKERPPVRLGVIPESWFMFFYPKTGYTGPYAFIVTVGTYLLSKEKLVVDEVFMQAVCLISLLYILNKKFGAKFQNLVQDLINKDDELADSYQKQKEIDIKEAIKILEGNETLKKAIGEATIAKREFVYLQMEMAYRERLAEMYKTIKKRLDCLAELENADRRNTHKNLVDYVLRNVNKAITPELEKNVMQSCISELNALAARA